MEITYKQLEKEYAKFVGQKFGVSCNSGTSALHLAFLAIGLKPGDEVIMCDFAMAACAFAVSYCGATPVFVDCGDDLNIDVSLVQEKITKKTKAILAIHTYGRLCDMKSLKKIAGNNNIYLIEDTAECQLPKEVYRSRADISCTSFYENKIIHAEEGGMCTTNSKLLADKMNYYKNMCFTEAHDYMHNHIGYNYRMANSQAKLALESLKMYGISNFSRREREWQLDLDVGSQLPSRDAVWVYDYLGQSIRGYDTRPFFKPLSAFPMYGGKCQSPKADYYSKIGHYIKL